MRPALIELVKLYGNAEHNQDDGEALFYLREIEADLESTAALQKRIEELEAVISKKDEALGQALNNLSYHEGKREYHRIHEVVTEALALKAGDVQAPKEVIDEVTLKFHHGIGEYSLDSIEAFGYGNHVEIRYDSHKTDKNAAIIHAVHKLRAAAPTDTEGK